MKLLLFIFSLLTFPFALLTVFASPALAAPHFSLDPTTDEGTNFTVELLIDTDNINIHSVDVIFDFNPQILEVSSVTFGTLFPSVQPVINNNDGVLSLFASFTDSLGSFSGTGTLATLSLNGLTPGTSPFNFRCTPDDTTDTNMNTISPHQDVVDCSLLVNGAYTVIEAGTTPSPSPVPSPSPTPTTGGTGSTPTSTPTPSLTPTPTWTSPVEDGANTPTLTQLPETAAFTPTLTLAILGATLVIGSGLLLAL
jgi:hypothetical protein